MPRTIKHEKIFSPAVLCDARGIILYRPEYPDSPLRRVLYDDDTVEVFEVETGTKIAAYALFPEDE